MIGSDSHPSGNCALSCAIEYMLLRSLKEEPLGFFCGVSNRVKRMLFGGLDFYFDESVQPNRREDLTNLLRFRGGVVTENPASRSITHCVTTSAPKSYRPTWEYITPHWIDDCERSSRLLHPDEHPLYQPALLKSVLSLIQVVDVVCL
ncbi:hypothetical protein PAPYR_8710 [Paratrimastix pyriformis]|uniref:BRCT domain-containing protein n=1 Tax=Paratrimastix pyriformis TaxID=342808 RepID=A0ABQ8UA33_9EUKA|nr:hypothetical protein PAPYR_8710 [Paratrimastix pyriformis]